MRTGFSTLLVLLAACPARSTPSGPMSPTCTLQSSGFGDAGTLPLHVDVIASGLEVPWSLAFLPSGKVLVSERPGRLTIANQGTIATVPITPRSEQGLLGVALHPDYVHNHLFYIYYTSSTDNRIERWRMADDEQSAAFDQVILSGIAQAPNHDGGRLRFGKDGLLYIATGDAQQPDRSQQTGLNGKLLRISPDGGDPEVVVTGIRNMQGFDWLDDGRFIMSDHGPSGEFGRKGHDEVNIAKPGDNLGWPTIYGCEQREGLVTPILTWELAVPPGGLAVYRGNSIPDWRGNIIVASLGAAHLHRVVLENDQVKLHEVYLEGQYGRLRDAIMGPDGDLYVTTSNCDGRGSCGADMDRILKIH